MKTFSQCVNHKKKWYLIDANNKTLGRLATIIAKYLSGKNKPEYTPSLDTGDFIVVINAKYIKVTGKKLKDKKYYHYSGYQGGLKEITLEKQLNVSPEKVIKMAVSGMLPKGVLGKKMLTKLKVYASNEHLHHAQNLDMLLI